MFTRRFTRLTIALAIVLTLTLPVLADGPDAVAWFQTQQNADGGFGSPTSTVGTTADVLIAVAATGDNAIAWSKDGNTPYSYLEANAGSIAGMGDAGRVILALVASGKNPRELGDIDLVTLLENRIGDDGQYGTSGMVNDQAYAMIGLASARRTIPSAAVDYLLSKQIEDGTWAWNGDLTAGSGDNNTAAMAVVALIAAGLPADNPQIAKTVAHFREQQNEDGGFPYIKPSAWGTDSDANSTAVVMWALLAAGEDPAGDDWKYEGQDGTSALDKLSAFQNESGAFRWQDAIADDNFMATVQAVVALEIKSLPFASMDVGETDKVVAVPVTIMPETGASTWGTALVLLSSGLAFLGAGLRLRKHK
jgi:prenyltransferase beta subunit